jgi:adenylyltransferase/sulfurtransferase
MLTKDELERYARQISLNGFGEEGQEKLKNTTALVAGVGGLGSPASLYLAAAGIGTLRIVDNDQVEASNLNRQVLHWEKNIGMPKALSAAGKLRELNPHIKVESLKVTINEDNVDQLLNDCDLIVDALDNLPTRYLINEAAVARGIPLFHGAVYGLEGRALTVIPGESACLYCLYHGVTMPPSKFPVVGVTPAIIGCIQATEVIKYITGLGKLLTNRLLSFDGLGMTFTEFSIKKDPNCKHCGNLNRQVN